VLVAVALLLTGAAAPEVVAQVQGVRQQLIAACRDAATRAPQRHAHASTRPAAARSGHQPATTPAEPDRPARCLVRDSLLNLPPPAASL